MSSSRYQPPIVTVDTVCLTVVDGRLDVLLIERAAEPFAGKLALPGVYMQQDETIIEASDRCLAAKASLVLPATTQRHTIGVNDSVARDPRGHSLSIVTAALLSEHLDASGTWKPVDQVRRLAFDHVATIANVRSWCERHLWSEPHVFTGLLADEVASTGEILAIVEAVTGQVMDTSNLRRRIASSGLFTDTGAKRSTGIGRPGTAWRLNRS